MADRSSRLVDLHDRETAALPRGPHQGKASSLKNPPRVWTSPHCDGRNQEGGEPGGEAEGRERSPAGQTAAQASLVRSVHVSALHLITIKESHRQASKTLTKTPIDH